MSKIKSCKSTFGKMTQNQLVQDLPSSISPFAEIDLQPIDGSLDRCVQISLRVAAQSEFTIAGSLATANTRRAANQYDITDAGRISLPIVAVEGLKLYIRSTGAAVVGGLSHTFIEGDTL